MKKFLKSKKVLIAAALATIMAIGGASYAWFTHVQSVDGGTLAMGKVEFEIDGLKKYEAINRPPAGGSGSWVFDHWEKEDLAEEDLMPSEGTYQEEIYVGYEITVPADSAAVMIKLPAIDGAKINFATNLAAMADWEANKPADWPAGVPGNAIMLLDPSGALYYDAVDYADVIAAIADPAYDGYYGPAVPEINIDTVKLAVDDSLTYYHDTATGALYAEVIPAFANNYAGGEVKFDVVFKVEYPSNIGNQFTSSKLEIGAGYAVGVQLLADAPNSMQPALDVFGIADPDYFNNLDWIH